MPDHVKVPELLLKKIRTNCPDIYELLQLREEAIVNNDQDKQKVLRKKLREKGFYLSRLAEGEDPFIHWSICNDEEQFDLDESEEILMTENEVVEHVAKWLEKNGWEIRSQCLGQQQGIDILAIKDSQTLIVEAKGARGSGSSPNTRREKFNSGQIKTHFGKPLVKCLEERNRNTGAKVAIAQPDNPYIKHCLASVIPEIQKIGIELYWVCVDGNVDIE